MHQVLPQLQALPQLHVGHAIGRVGPLTVIPIWTDAPMPDKRSYALPAQGALGLVSEHHEGPRVGELICDNAGDDPLLLLEGMTLDGGWQHRVLTRSLLLAPHQRTAIPVRCIEQSRWDGAHAQSFSRFDVPLRMRATLRNLDEPYAHRGSEPDQGRVWRRVADYQRRTGRTSATNSLHELNVASLADAAAGPASVRPLPGQRGVIIGALGQPVLAEITDHPDTLAQRWDALLNGPLLDVEGLPFVPTPAGAARAFAALLAAHRVVVDGDAGIGRSLRIPDEASLSLRGIADQRALLHASVINTRHELVLAA